MRLTNIITNISIFIVFIVFGSLISYFFAKEIVKNVKNVKNVNENKSLVTPKLEEIINLITYLSKKYHIPMPEIGIYPSREVNAFATGRKNNSLIAFSTGLINIMEMKDIKAVLAHELAHLVNRDLTKIIWLQGSIDSLLMLFNYLLFHWILKKKKRNNYFIIISFIIYYILSFFLRLIGIILFFAFVRDRELKADRFGAKMIGIDNMIKTLKKLLSLEKKGWIVDGLDLDEEDEMQLKREQNSEPISIQVTKFSPQQKNNFLLKLFNTHPSLQKRINHLEKIRSKTDYINEADNEEK